MIITRATEPKGYSSNSLHQDIFFPLKVWIVSISLIAPVFIFVAGAILGASFLFESDYYRFLLLFVWLGLFYSVPTFLVSWLVFLISVAKIESTILIKIVFDFIAITGMFITFYLLLDAVEWLYILIYGASVIAASLAFKVFKK